MLIAVALFSTCAECHNSKKKEQQLSDEPTITGSDNGEYHVADGTNNDEDDSFLGQIDYQSAIPLSWLRTFEPTSPPTTQPNNQLSMYESRSRNPLYQ